MTNIEKLKKRIKDAGLKKGYIAKVLGIDPSTLSRKLAGKSDFTAREIDILCNLLGIDTLEEKEEIFFNPEVAETATK